MLPLYVRTSPRIKWSLSLLASEKEQQGLWNAETTFTNLTFHIGEKIVWNNNYKRAAHYECNTRAPPLNQFRKCLKCFIPSYLRLGFMFYKQGAKYCRQIISSRLENEVYLLRRALQMRIWEFLRWILEWREYLTLSTILHNGIYKVISLVKQTCFYIPW